MKFEYLHEWVDAVLQSFWDDTDQDFCDLYNRELEDRLLDDVRCDGGLGCYHVDEGGECPGSYTCTSGCPDFLEFSETFNKIEREKMAKLNRERIKVLR